jgi:hypothetical protein
MNQIMTNTPLRDAMYAMSLAKSVPDAELLDEFVRRYPEHAEALTDFAIELAIDALTHGDDDEETEVPTDLEAISSAVSRVMSQFQNRLFEVSQERTAAPSARVATTSIANPFASLDRERFRALASSIDANAVMLSKLRDRLIDPATIPRGFCDHLADEMDEPVDALIAHLYAPPEVSSARQLYKAVGKPTLTARQSFEEAVAGSGLSDEQQRRLLSFRK